jgi:hypothetical protein
MIAPASFEDLTFPEQALTYWTKYEFNQWSRAGLNYFNSGSNSGNTAVYSTASLLHTGIDSIGGGALANNGKMYLGSYGGSGAYTLDTLTDTTASLGAISSNCQSAFYSAITNQAFLVIDGNVKVINCSDDSVQNIALTFGGQSIGYGVSLDGNYAYVNNFFSSKNINRVSLINTGSAAAFSGSFTGDPLKGTMGWDNKMYMGCGGGSTGIKTYDPATNTVANLAVPGKGSLGDSYRDIVQHYNGYLYSFPAYNANFPIIQIDPVTSTITNVVASITDPRVVSLCVGADGRVYGVGNGGASGYGVSIYNPITNEYTLESISANKNWNLIKMGARGDLYMFSGDGQIWKKTLINGGALQKPLQEYNGIVSRLQNT